MFRDYQLEAISKTFEWLSSNEGGCVVALPTGTGKSFVIAGTIAQALANWPSIRILMLTHVKELVDQNAEKMRLVWPNAPLGIHSQGLNQRDTVDQIVFGTIQSVAKTMQKRASAFGRRELVLIDEAHKVSPSEKTTYRKVLAQLEADTSTVRIVGYTATGWRTKQGSLTNDGVFLGVAYDKTNLEDFNEFIRRGYLCALLPRPTETEIDTSNVRISSTGDFNEKDLQEATNVDNITSGAIREMLQFGSNRKSWLIFSTGIEHAEAITRKLNDLGVSAEVTHSKLKKKHNDEVIAGFKNSEFRALVNADKLTTGFDCPQVDLIGMLRCTLSSSLHVQMLGRGTRPHPDKSDCLVLDFARNVPRLGPINDPVIPGPPGSRKGAPAPAKVCPNCGLYNATRVRECFFCGAAFPLVTNFKSQAGTHEIVKGLKPPDIYDWPVNAVFYRKQFSKRDETPMLKVVYVCGATEASELVLLQHKGFARHKAREWWLQRSRDFTNDAPIDIDEAIAKARNLPKPRFVKVAIHSGSKYPEVLGVTF